MASNHVAFVTAGGLTNATVAHSLYGYCTTGASTVTKVVTMYKTGSTAGAAWAAADLVHGLTITVRFQYANTAASPTLNVNSTGAKPIYKYGTTVATTWPAQAVLQLTYDTLLNTSGCWVINSINSVSVTTGSVNSTTGTTTATTVVTGVSTAAQTIVTGVTTAAQTVVTGVTTAAQTIVTGTSVADEIMSFTTASINKVTAVNTTSINKVTAVSTASKNVVSSVSTGSINSTTVTTTATTVVTAASM